MTPCRLRVLSLLLALGLMSPTAYSGELPSRASLAVLGSIGQVVVVVPSGVGDEGVLRKAVEQRLEAAGMAIDPNVDSRLVVKVNVTRDTSTTGQRHYSYSIALLFEEPAQTVREPRTTFYATTWSGHASITRFSKPAPFEAVLDQVDNKMSTFLAAVAIDTRSAEKLRD